MGAEDDQVDVVRPRVFDDGRSVRSLVIVTAFARRTCRSSAVRSPAVCALAARSMASCTSGGKPTEPSTPAAAINTILGDVQHVEHRTE